MKDRPSCRASRLAAVIVLVSAIGGYSLLVFALYRGLELLAR